jgi:uncharacterized membrane protein
MKGVIIFGIIAYMVFYGIFAAYLITKRRIVKSLEQAAKLLKPGMSEKDVEQAMMRYVRFPNELSTYDRLWGDVLIKSYAVKCPGLVLIPVPIVFGNRAAYVQLCFRDGVLENSSICSF